MEGLFLSRQINTQISAHFQLAGNPADLECHDIVLKGIAWMPFFFQSPPSKRILALQMFFQKKTKNHYRQQYCSEIIHIFSILFLQFNTLRYSVLHYAFHMESAVISYCMAKCAGVCNNMRKDLN